ncbi:MAG: hypothetical protein F6K28_22470, partial [Microcoleus sp. SIO2G3]|nr:hypothetical protein [Microcoleus sp. SIO2G3]
MTSQPTQIQALIQQIDAALSKSGPGLLWGLSSEAQQQRAVLLRTREYLVALLQSGGAPQSATPLNQFAQAQVPAAESAQQVLQSVMQEMSYLRTNVMQPLRSDLEQLQQQRSTLQQEVRQLEAQRQQYRLPPVNQQLMDELMRSITDRIQERLTAQIGQMGAISGDSTETDQYVLKLDSSLRVMFEALQADLQSYQRSLSVSLEKMHTLGQQSEAMFAALVNRLAQQLGREASSYLRPAEGEEVQIDRLLSELGLPSNTTASTSSSPQLSTPLSPDLLNVELEPLNLPPTAPIDEEITLFQVDPVPPATPPVEPVATPLPTDAPPTANLPAPPAADAELDTFYESLFGDRALPYESAGEANEPQAIAPPPEPIAPPPADLEALFADAPPVAPPAAEPTAPPPDAPQSLESLFTSPEAEAVPAAEPAEVESIASLTELIDQTPAPEAEPPAAPEPVYPETTEEDTYIPAPPEEDLLVSQESLEPTGLVQVDDTTLQQLTADLSNLEGLDLPPLETTPDELDLPTPEAAPDELAAPSEDFDLDALFDAAPAIEQPEPSESTAELENLSDLFVEPDVTPSDSDLSDLDDLLAIHTPPDAPPDLPPDAPPQPPVPPPDLPPDLPVPPLTNDLDSTREVQQQRSRGEVLAADVDDLFPLTVTPPPVTDAAPADLPVEAIAPAGDVIPAIDPLPDVAISAIEPSEDATPAIDPAAEPSEDSNPLDLFPSPDLDNPSEPPESLDSVNIVEPSVESNADLNLADLFAESPSLEDMRLPAVDPTTDSIDAGLTIEDLFE